MTLLKNKHIHKLSLVFNLITFIIIPVITCTLLMLFSEDQKGAGIFSQIIGLYMALNFIPLCLLFYFGYVKKGFIFVFIFYFCFLFSETYVLFFICLCSGWLLIKVPFSIITAWLGFKLMHANIQLDDQRVSLP